MKQKLIWIALSLIVASFFVGQPLFAQHVEINGLVGYRVAGNTKIPSGIIMPRESFNYQLVAAYVFESGLLFDASYLRSPSHIKFRESPRVNWQQLGDLQVSHLMAGVGYQHNDPEAAVLPFGVFRMGNMRFNSLSEDFDSFSKFSFAIEGGVKLPFNDWMGLTTLVNIMLPLHSGDGMIFPPNQAGYDFTPRPGVVLPQFGINTGIYFKF